MHFPIIKRNQVLAFRQQATHLQRRLSRDKLVEAAYPGLQDSSPRSALLALHARVRDVVPSSWEDPRLVQIWGLRGADYVVPRKDVGVFTLGRLPRDPVDHGLIDASMERVTKLLHQAPSDLSQQDLADLRSASMTGRIRIRWDGSHIEWWLVEPDSIDPEKARLELARRFLRSLGPSTPTGFAWWAGVSRSDAEVTFQSLESELSMIRLGSKLAWILRSDLKSLEDAFTRRAVRLLPPGDPFLGTNDRTMLVPKASFRAELWPRSVWPGALFDTGELHGTWRRQQGRVVIQPWKKLDQETMEAVEDEVRSMPLESKKEVRWIGAKTRKRQ